MVKASEIRRFVDQIVAAFSPQRVILFGSYANGKPTNDSDVDLLVIMPGTATSKQSLRTQLRIAQSLEASFPMDLIVRSAGEIAKRMQMDDFFIRDIVNNGKAIYEADHARAKNI